jgi:hypothetical protein
MFAHLTDAMGLLQRSREAQMQARVEDRFSKLSF